MRLYGWVVAALVAAIATQAKAQDAAKPKKLRVAAVTTEYRHNSHADMLCSRILQSETLDGKGAYPNLELVSLYTDQVPANDTSREFSRRYGFRICPTVEETLTLGTGKLAVDGVLLICEHGRYPESELGQTMFPKRRLFGQVVDVFEKAGAVVPVFCDKQLSHSWDEALWMVATAKRLKFPLMAGSSVPGGWRTPPADVKREAKLKEIFAFSYHTLDAYGFHGLEIIESLVERRSGGESGVKSIQCLSGKSAWDAIRSGVIDRALMDAATTRLKDSRVPKGRTIEETATETFLFLIEYEDGLRASMLTANYAVVEWAAAWRTAEGNIESTLFETQELRPFMHFALQLRTVEAMFRTGQPTVPLERTILTTGMLDAGLRSKKNGGAKLQTPWLKLPYTTDWEWKAPPPMPPGRPLEGP